MLPNRFRKLNGALTAPYTSLSRKKRFVASSVLLSLGLAASSPTDSADSEKASAGQTQGEAKKDAATATDRETSPDKDRVALSAGKNANRESLKPDLSAKATNQGLSPTLDEEPIAKAVRTMAECQKRFDLVKDYTCTFYKRERIDGKLSPLHAMDMKVRNTPRSVYLKFQQPHRGREAIYVEGRNDGRVLAHDVGFTKLLAGTMSLDPHGARAMAECRHPITEAGIGALIKTVAERWTSELDGSESVVLFDSNLRLGSSRCLLIEAIHPEKRPNFVFHKVRLFIHSELGFPIRLEGYDWPKESSDEPELVEEYVYDDIKLNVGLDDSDFDVANRKYSFGRF